MTDIKRPYKDNVKRLKMYQLAPDMYDLLVVLYSSNMALISLIERLVPGDIEEMIFEGMKMNAESIRSLVNEIKPGSFK